MPIFIQFAIDNEPFFREKEDMGMQRHGRWRTIVWLVLALFAWGLSSPAQATVFIDDIRLGQHQGTVRFVLDISGPVEHSVFAVEDPPRIVIDMSAAGWRVASDRVVALDAPLVRRARYGIPKPGTARVVLDLKRDAAIVRAFELPPGDGKGYRIVLDLAPKQDSPEIHAAETWQEPNPDTQSSFVPIPVDKPVTYLKEAYTPVIVIDAGHGGQDPGAIGRSGIFEKKITLRYARALQKALERTGRYRVYLTREDDVFIKLRDRVALAREFKGDMFISLHADSILTSDARGLSIYTLSEKASDKESAALAQRENKADLIAGVDFAGQEDDDVISILIDLMQRETKNKSSDMAEIFVGSLKGKVRLLGNTHRYAGFAVLTAADIPSVLIELGFLSNRHDEANLQSEGYERTVITGLVRGIDRYFEKYPKRVFEE